MPFSSLYFLIGVGMLIDIHVITGGFNVVKTAVIMTATALVCKWMAAFIAQRMFGLSSDGRRIMFGLTSGKAAATIAAVMVGYSNGLIDEDIMNGAVLMILACRAVASITTERAARNRRMHIQESEMKPGRQGSVRAARQPRGRGQPHNSGRNHEACNPYAPSLQQNAYDRIVRAQQ